MVSLAVLLLVLHIPAVLPERAFLGLEDRLYAAGTAASLARDLRATPRSFVSLALEPFQPLSVQVEGVEVHLLRRVEPTERVEEVRFFSDTLGQERTYRVYLPPGYEESHAEYPTLYLLHGMSQGHQLWTEVAQVDRIVEAKIEAGHVQPLILVMPNGNYLEHDTSTTSLYDNRCETGLDAATRVMSAVGRVVPFLRIYTVSCEGNFEDFIVRDLVADVDARYRTTGERHVGGYSLGGRAAVYLALHHPHVFQGAFGLSGTYDFVRHQVRSGELTPSPDVQLFLAAGAWDQRGVYGRLSTMLLYQELLGHGLEPEFRLYRGGHTPAMWLSTLPEAMTYFFGLP